MCPNYWLVFYLLLIIVTLGNCWCAACNRTASGFFSRSSIRWGKWCTFLRFLPLVLLLCWAWYGLRISQMTHFSELLVPPSSLLVRNDTPLWVSRSLTAAINSPPPRNTRIISNRGIWQRMLLVGRLGLRLPPDVLLVDSDVQPYLWQPGCSAAQT